MSNSFVIPFYIFQLERRIYVEYTAIGALV